MAFVSKTTVKLSEFRDNLVNKTKQSVSKLDQRIKVLAKQVSDLYARANKPLASLGQKSVVQKEQGDDCCSSLCHECFMGCCQGCHGIMWA